KGNRRDGACPIDSNKCGGGTVGTGVSFANQTRSQTRNPCPRPPRTPFQDRASRPPSGASKGGGHFGNPPLAYPSYPSVRDSKDSGSLKPDWFLLFLQFLCFSCYLSDDLLYST